MADTNKKKPRSGFQAPAYGTVVDTKNNPVKYLPNGTINPAWAKKNPGKK